MSIITSPPPEPGDLLEGCLGRVVGEFRLVLKVKEFVDGAGVPTGFLVSSLCLTTKHVYNWWWSDMWLHWGVVRDGR